MTDWKNKARTLVEDLFTSDHLSDNPWRDAFQEIPRHLFVPQYWHDPNTLLAGDDPATAGQWLQAVYSDQSLTTQYAPVPGTELMWATSSSTKPSLMAHMLTMLTSHTSDTVLEIGTGTGYNTALLCHRLRDTHVTSIDIDPALIADARARLAALGYHPTLLAGNGARGARTNAPYDRIIATCAVPTIPPAGSTNSPRPAPSWLTCAATWPAVSPPCTKSTPTPSPAGSPMSRATSCGCASTWPTRYATVGSSTPPSTTMAQNSTSPHSIHASSTIPACASCSNCSIPPCNTHGAATATAPPACTCQQKTVPGRKPNPTMTSMTMPA